MAEVPSVLIDQQADAAYLVLADLPVARSVDHGAFVADYGVGNRIAGIEVLTLSRPLNGAAVMGVVGTADYTTRERVASFTEEIRRLQSSPGIWACGPQADSGSSATK